MEWCVLTNGDEYRIYNTFAKAEAEKKVFRRITLSDRDQRTFCIETLLLLSKQQIVKRLATLTPDRRPILTAQGGCPGSA